MAKPASHIDWTDGDAAKQVEPSAGKKLLGWVALERPPFEFMNHLFFRLDEWQKFFEGELDLLAGVIGQFDAVIGVGDGATHADLNTAVADAALGVNANVLVRDLQSIVATQILTKAGWRITFLPKALYTQAAGTTPAIRVTADNITLRDGKFIEFDSGADIAIQVDVGAKNTIIEGIRFKDCDVPINDLGTNTIQADTNIVEV